MHIVYLHGFASSPQSSKAQFFQRKYQERGVPIEIPALDQRDFEHMTVSSMLQLVDQTVAGRPCVMMGSSLGGFLAGLYAARNPKLVERLVLLAPALEFSKKWQERFQGHELEEWRRQGWKNFFHYGRKRQERLAYGFVEDAMHYEGAPVFPQPALILHGTQDDVVPAALSRDYASRHPNILLKEFPSGHELTDVTEDLWTETAAFLALEHA